MKLDTGNLWQFNYHRGPAPLTGIVSASDDRMALQVATVWCRKNNFRPPASVRPMIVADESILREPPPGVPEPLPSAVQATTSVSGR